LPRAALTRLRKSLRILPRLPLRKAGDARLNARRSWNTILALAPLAWRARLSALADQAGEVPFLEFALNALQNSGPGKRDPLAAVLLESGVLVRVVSDPELTSIEEAMALTKAAALVDDRIDAKLVTSLTSQTNDLPKPRAVRTLELVDAISDCKRLVAPLMRFAKIPDAKIRSKAVKLMARASQNNGWVESILSDPDARVRGNLVEGLFRQLGKRAEPLLRRATQDPHNRVAVTALLALAQLGDQPSRDELERLKMEGDDYFRPAAAWAIAQLEISPSNTTPHPSV